MSLLLNSFVLELVMYKGVYVFRHIDIFMLLISGLGKLFLFYYGEACFYLMYRYLYIYVSMFL